MTPDATTIKRLRDALTELVACKGIKEEYGQIDAYLSTEAHTRWHSLRADYSRRQPLAWDNARTVLAERAGVEGAETEELKAELEKAKKLAEHWRSNHDHHVAVRRAFMVRGDLPMLDPERGLLMSFIAGVERERDDLQSVFDRRYAADMRAIKRWQKANPGNDLVWPDHADMVVWLLEQLDKAKK